MGCSIDGGRKTADRYLPFFSHTFGGQRSSVSGHLDEWETRWAAYDEPTYQAVLRQIQPDDRVLDIGAGDLRLTRRMAERAKHVYAIELQPALLANQTPLPANLSLICGDARRVRWPAGITVGVLLMRHCTQVGLYAARLRSLGCQRLITNARWRLDVEVVDLANRLPWTKVDLGWYACICGQTGFKPGPPAQFTYERMDAIAEVETCPACCNGCLQKRR